MTFLVTGGAGFIGSALVRAATLDLGASVHNLDALTYAANLKNLEAVSGSSKYRLCRGDIKDAACVRELLDSARPTAVFHLAAESHVDRSIDGPLAFVETNVVGTAVLLSEVLQYWRRLGVDERAAFRFVHVSTDEVFGSLGATGLFSESSAYDPRSPYAASKAASDHLVRAWHHTYGIPILVTNCSNNFGPYQFPEKLIPLTIVRALQGRPIPVYGKGANVRDWMHVDDHVSALLAVWSKGSVGSTYTISARNERTNIEVVRSVCSALDELLPTSANRPHQSLIQFVEDRPGHDFRYAIDPSRLETELGWRPTHTFETGIRSTVQWYLENRGWWSDILDNRYDTERLGRAKKL